MDWLRRNWPDLLIVIALIAVIGGIAMTLLTGGFSVPLFNSAPSSPSPSLSTPSTSAPTTVTPTQPSATDADADAAATEPDDSGGSTADVDASTSSESDGASDAGTTGGISVLPPSDPGSEADSDASSATTAEASESGSTDEASTSASNASTSASTSTAAPSSTSPSAASSTAQPGTEAPYRVSVGAFGNPSNAERFAAQFRDAGFPVFVGTQDDLSIVLVGPYDTLAEAEAASARVVAGDFDVDRPVIFLLDDGAVAGQSDAAEPAAEPAPAAAPAEPVATASTGTFLQIGAYGDAASAQPQIERAEALGFDVDTRSEDGLLKLVLGPFDDAGLASARTRLEQAGIEFFVRAD